MSTDIVLADIHTSIKNAAKKMIERDVDHIIISENNLPVGIVTCKDLIRKNIVIENSKDMFILKAMSAPLIHCGPDQSIWEVVDIMYARSIKSIPIIDEYEKLMGVVSINDIIKAFSLYKN